ncbi:MAG TPA: YciI family protein [Mycobacteriales bacterium]|nr:YciI family protein [Mycobacteriales bacterium]
MSQYLVLIYEDEAGYANADETVGNEVMAGHGAFGEKHGAVIAGGNALQPAATATSLRSNAAGEFTVTDGPFAETKEALGGYYLIEAGDLDAAIAIAKDIPARFGGLEIRPVRVFD